MKKIGKKLSYFTKVLLVIGLLFNNLSSLTVVLAYEGDEIETVEVSNSEEVLENVTDSTENNKEVPETTNDETSNNEETTETVTVTDISDNSEEVTTEVPVTNDNKEVVTEITADISDDNKIVINYSGNIDNTDEVKVTISEKYTYLNETKEENTISYDTDGSKLTSGKLEIESSLLSNAKFDGTYSASVTMYNVTKAEDLFSGTVSKKIEFEKGMSFTVLDSSDKEISADSNGTYKLDKEETKITVAGVLHSGGLNPLDVYTYNNEEFTATELLNLEYKNTKELSSYLYGDHKLNTSFELTKENGEKLTYSKDISIQYGSYSLNTDKLNEEVTNQNLDSKYNFVGESTEGSLNVTSLDNATILDIDNILKSLYGENITYKISTSEYDDISTYSGELSDLSIDSDTKITISDGELTLTYVANVSGDINGDGKIDESDLSQLIDEVIEVETPNPDKSDLYNEDDKVDFLDAIYLSEALKNKDWNITVEELQNSFTSQLYIDKESVTSGEEFSIDYITTLSDTPIDGFMGAISYDKSILELVTIESSSYVKIGNDKEGKFLYFMGEPILGTYLPPSEDSTDETGTYEPTDYVLLTFKFKALKSGNPEITTSDVKYTYTNNYYNVDSVSTSIVVNESNDNQLSSLTIAGQNIELQDGVYEYEITVSSDVTTADVEAILSNSAAYISSLVAPEELAEGKNTIIITVTAENGEEKVYTITVNKEAKPAEASQTNTVAPVSYSNNYVDSSTSNDTTKEVTDAKDDKNKDKDKDKDKNKDEKNKDEGKLSRIIIVILILLAIAGLIYLIFKDDDDEEEKKANKDIEKFKKEDIDSETNNSRKQTTTHKDNPKDSSKDKKIKKGR